MAVEEAIRNAVGLRWRGASARRRSRRLDFFGVGVQKGGTTSMHHLLRLHPQIEMPGRRKELHYFDRDEHFDGIAPRDGYAALQNAFFFDRPLAGEITPSYVYWRDALERIRAYNADARIVVLLRNPMYRAFSHWGHLTRRKRPPDDGGVDPLTLRLLREQRALERDPRFQDLALSHIGRGRYGDQIRHLRALFPEEHLLFVKSERFFADQNGVADEVCRFLGAAPLTAVASPPPVRANSGDGKPMTRADWDAVHAHLAGEIDAVEQLLGWDCSDWRVPPRD